MTPIPLAPPYFSCPVLEQVRPGDSMSACGGYSSVASKIFMELGHLFGWDGPASGMPSSVDQVSICLPSLTQVRSFSVQDIAPLSYLHLQALFVPCVGTALVMPIGQFRVVGVAGRCCER